MGLDNPIHIAFLLILLLLVFGAKRLPEIGRSLGTGMRGFKESISGETMRPSPTAQQHEPATTAASTPGGASVVGPVEGPAVAPVERPEAPFAA
jgi:sec-independent protein translocase protein TatA